MKNTYLTKDKIKQIKGRLIGLKKEKNELLKNINNILDKTISPSYKFIIKCILEKDNREYSYEEIEELIYSLPKTSVKYMKEYLGENNYKLLIKKIYKLLDIVTEVKNINSAIKLPSLEIISDAIREEKSKLVKESIEKEKENPTDLSKFMMLKDYEVDDCICSYTKLWCFINALPFSLDPKNSRYISLTKSPMMLGEDTKRFNHHKVNKPTANGLDIIKEMGTWSDTVRASIQLKRLLVVQSYLERNLEVFHKTIKELEGYEHIKTNCDNLVVVATSLALEEDVYKRSQTLIKFYLDLDKQYGNIYGFRNDIALFISCYLDFENRFDSYLPKFDYPVTTSVEDVYTQIADGNFDEEFMIKNYGVSLKKVKELIK